MEPVNIYYDEFLDDTDRINVHRYTVYHDTKLHQHNFIELAYICEGKGLHKIGTSTDGVSRGNLVLINAFVPHQFISDKSNPLTIYNCIFLPSSIDESLDDDKNFLYVAYHYLFHTFHQEETPLDYLKFNNPKLQNIERILQEMEGECIGKQNGYRQILKSDLLRLLVFIFRVYLEDTTLNVSVYKKLIVQNAVEYMNNFYMNEIHSQELAEKAYISKSYFCRIFKEVTNKTVVRYLQELRVSKACELLSVTSLSINEVAARTGYTDIKHFYKVFNQIMHVNPGTFRK